jgi:hypothetical protein
LMNGEPLPTLQGQFHESDHDREDDRNLFLPTPKNRSVGRAALVRDCARGQAS